MTTRERIASEFEDALFLDGPEFDEAIVGVAHRYGMEPVVCYDMSRVIGVLMQGGLDREAAEEWFEFNIIGAWMGETTPVFLDTRPAE